MAEYDYDDDESINSISPTLVTGSSANDLDQPISLTVFSKYIAALLNNFIPRGLAHIGVCIPVKVYAMLSLLE